MGLSPIEMVKERLRQAASAFLLLSALFSCGGSELSASPYEGSEPPQIASLFDSGSLKLGRVAAVAENRDSAQPFGEIVSLGLKNETDKPVQFRIDCGTVLIASDSSYPDLIVSRSVEAKIDPYAAWSGKIEAFALQLERRYPQKPAEYRIGKIAGGDLRRFAECFCFNRPRPPQGQAFDMSPVQYAFWRVAGNVKLSNLLDYMKRRGNPTKEESAEVEQKAREQARFTEQLLEDCNLSVKFID